MTVRLLAIPHRAQVDVWPAAFGLAAALILGGGARAQDEGLSFGSDPTAETPAAETDSAATPAGGDAPAGDAATGETAAPDAAADADAAATAADDTKSALDEGINLTLQDRIKAVSRKTFMKQGRFEIDPQVALTTNDAFFRTWMVGGRAAFHLDDAFALELGGGYAPPFFWEPGANRRFTNPSPQETVEQLRLTNSLISADAKLLGLLDAGITFSPVYGKVAILSDQIINFDAFVSAGGGVTFDTGQDTVHPTMNVGMGVRVFILRWLVVRADLRDYIYPQDRNKISTLQNLLLLNVGAGIFIPFDFSYRYEAAKVNR